MTPPDPMIDPFRATPNKTGVVRHVAAIVAMSKNRIIGKDGGLPWHLPEDLKRFKELTSGHAVLMGRRTYESLPEKFRPLPNRFNIVATRDQNFNPPGVMVVKDVETAIKRFIDGEVNTPSDTLWVIGGGQVYTTAMPFFDEIYVTLVENEVDGDASFPVFEERYQETSCEKREGFSFLVYHRLVPVVR